MLSDGVSTAERPGVIAEVECLYAEPAMIGLTFEEEELSVPTVSILDLLVDSSRELIIVSAWAYRRSLQEMQTEGDGYLGLHWHSHSIAKYPLWALAQCRRSCGANLTPPCGLGMPVAPVR